ncbi:MAG: hypothetical protein ACLPOA_21065, partial [Methylocella sp.]
PRRQPLRRRANKGSRFSGSLKIPQPGRHFLKIARAKHKPIENFRLRQIPNSDLAEPCKSAFAQTANRIKTFHVKQFCPIGP